jgi:hypothetical protein
MTDRTVTAADILWRPLERRIDPVGPVRLASDRSAAYLERGRTLRRIAKAPDGTLVYVARQSKAERKRAKRLRRQR